jgi:hypothetical protein
VPAAATKLANLWAGEIASPPAVWSRHPHFAWNRELIDRVGPEQRLVGLLAESGTPKGYICGNLEGVQPELGRGVCNGQPVEFIKFAEAGVESFVALTAPKAHVASGVDDLSIVDAGLFEFLQTAAAFRLFWDHVRGGGFTSKKAQEARVALRRTLELVRPDVVDTSTLWGFMLEEIEAGVVY